MLSIGVAADPIRTDRINRFLLERDILIKDNPCVSPDFCINWPGLCVKLGSGASAALRQTPPRWAN